MPNGVIVNYDTVQNQFVHINGLEGQRPGISDPTQLKDHDRSLSAAYVKYSVDALRLERALEQDTNSSGALAELLDLADMRADYLSGYGKSLLQARYGDYDAHRKFLLNEAVPSGYGTDFTQGVQQYLNLFEMVDEAGDAGRALDELNGTELDSLRSLAGATSDGLGGAFAASLLSIYYDEGVARSAPGGGAKSEGVYAPPTKPESEKDVDSPGEFSLYPNPASRTLTLTGPAAGTVITVFDHQGRTVSILSATVHQTEIPLHDLPAGMYVVRFTFGDSLFTKRFVKQ